MDTDLIKSILAGLVRYILMSIFGGLIAAGYISESNLLLASGLIAGALIVVASMVWRKIKTKYQLEAAKELKPTATLADIKERAAQNLAEAAPITKVLP